MASVTYEAAIDEVFAACLDAWHTANSEQSIAPPGALIFEQLRVDLIPSEATPKPWGRVTHAMGAGQSRSVGGRLWAYEGSATFDVFVPFQTYEQAAGTIAQRFVEVILRKFRRLRSYDVLITSATPQEPVKDGPFFNIPVLIGFTYHTTA